MRWMTLIEAICILAATGALVVRFAGGGGSASRSAGLGAGWNRRLWTCLATAFLLHLLLVAPSLVQIGGCRHERPLGILGGTGTSIGKGKPEGTTGATGAGDAVKQVAITARMLPEGAAARRRAERGRDLYMTRISRDGLLQLLKSREGAEVEMSEASRLESALDSVGGTGAGDAGALGLPQGQGSGPTAAGSPWGSRVGGKLWLYRLKYPGGDWSANPRALPALLREVHLVTNIPVSNKQETLTLSDLPHHRGPYMPSMLFMTGTGHLQASPAECANLRSYLLGGGMLVADSSGGDFERRFDQFMSLVLPGRRLRPIEHDHEVYRGRHMPYKLPRGCPIYREHGSADARGIFAEDGRLMVFFSPGDLGSAWAVVDLGRKRGAVEQAFQIGTNLVAYSLMHVRDTRPAK